MPYLCYRLAWYVVPTRTGIGYVMYWMYKYWMHQFTKRSTILLATSTVLTLPHTLVQWVLLCKDTATIKNKNTGRLCRYSFSRSRAEGTPNKQTNKQSINQSIASSPCWSYLLKTNHLRIRLILFFIHATLRTHSPSQQNEQASHYATRYTIPISLTKDTDDTVTVPVLNMQSLFSPALYPAPVPSLRSLPVHNVQYRTCLYLSYEYVYVPTC
jgi:hypothetical protein